MAVAARICLSSSCPSFLVCICAMINWALCRVCVHYHSSSSSSSSPSPSLSSFIFQILIFQMYFRQPEDTRALLEQGRACGAMYCSGGAVAGSNRRGAGRGV